MRYLGMSGNQLTDVPDYLGDSFTDAYLIDYADNKLTKMPKVGPNLRQLYVGGNQIRTIRSGSFERAEHLYELFASDSQVEDVEPGAWAGALSLGWIKLEVGVVL